MKSDFKTDILKIRQGIKEELTAFKKSSVIDLYKYKLLIADLAVCNFLLSEIRSKEVRKIG